MGGAKKRKEPGFEPALGRADPTEEQPSVPPPPGYETHFPARNGAVCGKVFTHAKYYDPIAPTCAWCARWLAASKAVTAAHHAPILPPPIEPAPTTPRDGRKPTES